MADYRAFAGQDKGTVEALGFAALSIQPMVRATSDDADECLAEAMETLGHEDVYVLAPDCTWVDFG